MVTPQGPRLSPPAPPPPAGGRTQPGDVTLTWGRRGKGRRVWGRGEGQGRGAGDRDAGGEARKKINLTMNHADLKNHVSNDFWSLLVYSGYLTVGKNSSFDVDHEDLELRIPNKSILSCFRSQILDYFKNNSSRLNKYSQLVEFIFKKDPEQLRICIDRLLNNFISIRDFSKNSPKEDYYHGFLNGVFSTQTDLLKDYTSNCEAGKASQNTGMVKALSPTISSIYCLMPFS